MEAIDPFEDLGSVSREDLFSHARDFELLVADFYRRHNCSVQDIGGKGERGADLIVTAGEKRIAVQVKCATRDIGVNAVRQTKRGQIHYQADEGVLICLGGVGWQAKDLALLESIKVIAGNELFRRLDDSEKAEFRRIESLAVSRRTLIATSGITRRSKR